MKCSELIYLLQKVIEDHGDCVVEEYAPDRYGDLTTFEITEAEYNYQQNILILTS